MNSSPSYTMKCYFSLLKGVEPNMGEPYFDKDGAQVYGGKGRKPKDFWDRAKNLELYTKDGEGNLYLFNPEQEKKSVEAQIKEYMLKLQQNSRDNCSTCKQFSIPTANWPHKKRQGICALSKEEVGKTDWCRNFCRPGELTETEKWRSLDKKEQKKIIATERAQKKRLKAIVKKFNDNKNIDKKVKAEINALKLNIKGNLADLYAAALEKRYERETTDFGQTMKNKIERTKATEANRQKAAEFLGIGYRKRKREFSAKGKTRKTIGSITKFLRDEHKWDVKAEFVMNEGWLITKGEETFGPAIM